MAHFAKLDDNNTVIEVHVVNNNDILNLEFPASEPYGIEFLQKWSGSYTNWRQTSYNSNFRKRYACIGDVYDSQRDAFVPPQPFESWVLNEDTCIWEPPIPYPEDTSQFYMWDESTTSWKTHNFN